MPKKIEAGDRYRLEAMTKIQESSDTRALYIAIHGGDPAPTRDDLQRFRNRLNPARSNPGLDMVGLCIQHLPELQNMTLADFFGIDTEGNQKK